MQFLAIDFFTIIAQVINFIVLVLLLRHFLYKRVIRTMEEREKRISSGLEEALQKKKEAQTEAESYRMMKQELLDRREKMLAEIREEIEAMRKDLIKKARDEVEESKSRWYEALERQKEAFLMELRRRAGEEIHAVARRALHDLADYDLEQHIINNFIRRLGNMGDDEKKAFRGVDGIVIKSAFEIPENMRRDIQQVLAHQMGDVRLQFKTSPDLICGIELSVHSTRITWALAGYLDALEEELSRALERGEEIEVKEETGWKKIV